VQFQNRTYQLQGQGQGYRLRGAPSTVCEAFDGSIELVYEGRALPYRLLIEGSATIPVETEKTRAPRLAAIHQVQRRRAPPAGHLGKAQPKGDITELQKRGHFSFGLTVRGCV